MNAKVELKFLRNLINAVFSDYSKTEIMEDVYNNPNKTGADLDCKSLIMVSENIKNKEILSTDKINNIFNEILPSINKPRLDERKQQSFFKYYQENESPIKIFKYIIFKKVFEELSFVMGVIIYNFSYYQKNDTFLVIYSHIKDKICKYSKRDLLFYTEIFNNIKTENKHYHKENKVYQLEDLYMRFKTMNPAYREALDIKQLKIYGSYAKKYNNKYSDLDLLIITNNTIISEISLSNYAKRVFEAELGISIDVTIIRANRVLDGFERNILEYAIDVPLEN